MPSRRVPFNGEWVYVLFIVDNEGVVNGIKEDKGRGDKCKEVRYEGVVTEMNNDTGKVLFLDGDKLHVKFRLESKGSLWDLLDPNNAEIGTRKRCAPEMFQFDIHGLPDIQKRRRLTSPYTHQHAVRDISGKQGEGVFATSTIYQGEQVVNAVFNVGSLAHFRRDYKRKWGEWDPLSTIVDDATGLHLLDPTWFYSEEKPYWRYMNSSATPNVELSKKAIDTNKVAMVWTASKV